MTSSCVYILYSEKLDKYYVGSTDDLALRLHIHNHPHEDRKFTAKGLPWLLKCRLDCCDKTSSQTLERKIKSMKSMLVCYFLQEHFGESIKLLRTSLPIQKTLLPLHKHFTSYCFT